MSFFEGLEAEEYDRQYSDRLLLKRVFTYFKPQRFRLLLVGLLTLFISMIGAILPIIVSRGVDGLQHPESKMIPLLLAGSVVLIGFLSWIANWTNRRLVMRAIAAIVMSLAEDAFLAATKHDLSFYDKFSSGKIVSRITSDTRDFGSLVGLSTDLIAELGQSVILSIVLLTIEWQLTLILFAIIPVVFLLTAVLRNLARKVTQQGMRAMAEVNSTIKETVSGITVAKNFRQESRVYADFDHANQQSYRLNVKRGIVLTLVFPMLNTCGGIASGILVYIGGLNVIEGIVTAGAWYLFLLSLDRFLFPVLSLSSFLTQIQTGLAAAERVFSLIDAVPVVHQTAQNPVPKIIGRIDFEKVNFYYKSSEPVLENFNLRVQPGETLALVGHTGAGKSSIGKLIARFYEFQGGMILIDDQDIRTFDLKTYRKQLGIVSQSPFLFSGTVLDNIRYANQEVSEIEIEKIACQIGGGEWLEILSRGLLTDVGERGGMLSMGQRQLVSLMRVLVQKPAIFILDEATASVDPFTEWQIQQGLSLILSATTSILIAHRLSTVKSADRIIVMDNGRILEEGNHKTLLNMNGYYSDLYNTYFRHQSLAYIEQAKALMLE